MIFVGDDWAEAHHDVHVMDRDGKRLAAQRFPEGVEGIGRFHELVAGLVPDPSQVMIGIETDRGLWPQALLAAGYRIYVVNPLVMARYRKVHHLAGAKSDRADAKDLANLVRTDRHQLRGAAVDSGLAEGIKIVARAHQNLIWERTRHTNRLRSALREYYPTALRAFSELAHRDAVAVLERAPTPQQGRTLSIGQIKTVLVRGGRKRNIERRATEIQAVLRAGQLETGQQVAVAFGATTKAAVAVIAVLNRQIGELATELGTHFERHPDAGIYLSQPGLGVVLGARVLAEFGDDPNRYPDAKSRKNYAGTSPITRASGTTRVVSARWRRNNRLGDGINKWAFSSLTTSDGARTFYDHKRAGGNTHNQAIRALGNRLVGILHGCLKTGTLYDEHTAWAHRQPQPETKAA